MTKPTIDCAPNGPYLAKGLELLTNAKGERLATRAVTALCRCGGSSNKPYCDGTHSRNGFSDARSSDGENNRRKNYVGRGITVHDNRAICAHAGYCTDSLPSVFNSDKQPWIDPDGAAVDAMIATIKKCPSGALSYSLDDVEHRDGSREPEIAATENGPYNVTGGIELRGAQFGDGASLEHFTLCRCGASKNKPFCDGSHWDVDFKG
ncbi:MAG: CDGSH iron-sulfur domain-containing protein [Pseudomonadota bacterium]|nr:CDGSH iron-sulfur domain-containing protein [Pseudomonadota bacterium]